MTSETRFLLIACAACVGLIGLPGAASSGDTSADRGALLLAPFKAELKAALRQGMQGGVSNAVSVCSDAAPALAESYSVDGILMGRSSHRLRNPRNAAPVWVSDAMNAYVDSEGNRQPVTVKLQDNRRGYVEPIITQAVCLACHGEKLGPDVASSIASEYPNDQATGFNVGDVRGVFWVEYPEATPASPESETGG